MTNTNELSPKIPKAFYWLTAARLTATFGMFFNIIAVNIFVLEITGSAAWVGFLALARIISGMIFSPYIGSLADKIDRKKIMVFSDFILAFFILLTIFIPKAQTPYYLVFAMVVIGVFSSAVDIALSAAVPAILHSDNTIKANSILVGGRNLVIGAAGIVSVFIKELLAGYNGVFIVNALAYLVSGFIILSLQISTSEKSAPKKKEKKNFLAAFKEDYADVFALPQFKVIAVMIFILTFDGLAAGAQNVGWPVFSNLQNPRNPFLIYGLMMAAWSAGNVIGVFWLSKSALVKKMRAENLYLIFTAMMSAGLILTVQIPVYALMFSGACLAGFGDGAGMTFFNTYLQGAPDGARGKLFGLSSTCMRTGLGVSFILMPFLITSFPVGKIMLFAHGPLLVIILFTWIFVNRRR